MHLRRNGIKYNVSKGAVARGGEELGIIWHQIGTWQGRMTRCSHDVAAVKNQEDGGGGGVGGMELDLREEGMLPRLFTEYYYCYFSPIFPCFVLFYFFPKFTSTISQQLKDRTF